MTMNAKLRNAANHVGGFSLVELMVSMAVLLVISGSAIGALGFYQKQYRSSEIKRGLELQIRAAMAQMAQDTGQAGLANSGMVYRQAMAANSNTTKSNTQYLLGSGVKAGDSSAISISTTNLAFPTATTGLYKFQRVLVDTGGTTAPGMQEIVTIGTVYSSSVDLLPQPTDNSITVKGPSFLADHNAGVAVIPFGVFPEGILYPDGTTGASSATSLRLFGDLEGDGLLKLVIYQCPKSGTIGPFSREVWDLASNTIITHVTLLDNVDMTLDTSGNHLGCQFSYNKIDTNDSTIPKTILADGNLSRFVLGVSVTLRAGSSAADPQTGQTVWQTRSFLNIQPRNILNAYNRTIGAFQLVTAYDQYQLQVKPTNAAAIALFGRAEQPN